ncbi:DUF423 domain-containing protein [Sneathiella chinensis]|uniref:DUF423 domain-containing protein n=1 Tax=Sneathiella chinensis TaxID=349750 RepID=A0ABQ5U2V7_9PROT|nr:DUF423 domain-containing protein [Sneathiella chinensis]GLQ05515.1 DUF423 domain-containing protein [Sneathiella chinensis]
MRFPWIAVAGVMGAMGVIMGAMGAHGVLEDTYREKLYSTAFDYHMLHVLALLGIGIMLRRQARGRAVSHAAGALFVTGTLLFSGSLYYLGRTGEVLLPMVTPAGGSLLILGWLCLALGGLHYARS